MTDQMQRPVRLARYPPRRIISLVPSQTELLSDLGLEAEVVGITKFCIHPGQWFRSKIRIGGTKQLHLDRIAGLEPDLIIGNKEENDKEQITWLAARFPVWMSDVGDLDDALEMIRRVGELVGKTGEALRLAEEIQAGFASLTGLPHPTLRAAYFIWRQPLMAVARCTFIDDMLERSGFINVFGHLDRYPRISPQQLAQAHPDLILLSSEPYPFKDRHLDEFREICPRAVIQLVDGELFSWYGSRLLRSPAYFRKLRAGLMPHLP